MGPGDDARAARPGAGTGAGAGTLAESRDADARAEPGLERDDIDDGERDQNDDDDDEGDHEGDHERDHDEEDDDREEVEDQEADAREASRGRHDADDDAEDRDLSLDDLRELLDEDLSRSGVQWTRSSSFSGAAQRLGDPELGASAAEHDLHLVPTPSRPAPATPFMDVSAFSDMSVARLHMYLTDTPESAPRRSRAAPASGAGPSSELGVVHEVLVEGDAPSENVFGALGHTEDGDEQSRELEGSSTFVRSELDITKLFPASHDEEDDVFYDDNESLELVQAPLDTTVASFFSAPMHAPYNPPPPGPVSHAQGLTPAASPYVSAADVAASVAPLSMHAPAPASGDRDRAPPVAGHFIEAQEGPAGENETATPAKPAGSSESQIPPQLHFAQAQINALQRKVELLTAELEEEREHRPASPFESQRAVQDAATEVDFSGAEVTRLQDSLREAEEKIARLEAQVIQLDRQLGLQSQTQASSQFVTQLHFQDEDADAHDARHAAEALHEIKHQREYQERQELLPQQEPLPQSRPQLSIQQHARTTTGLPPTHPAAAHISHEAPVYRMPSPAPASWRVSDMVEESPGRILEQEAEVLEKIQHERHRLSEAKQRIRWASRETSKSLEFAVNELRAVEQARVRAEERARVLEAQVELAKRRGESLRSPENAASFSEPTAPQPLGINESAPELADRQAAELSTYPSGVPARARSPDLPRPENASRGANPDPLAQTRPEIDVSASSEIVLPAAATHDASAAADIARRRRSYVNESQWSFADMYPEETEQEAPSRDSRRSRAQRRQTTGPGFVSAEHKEADAPQTQADSAASSSTPFPTRNRSNSSEWASSRESLAPFATEASTRDLHKGFSLLERKLMMINLEREKHEADLAKLVNKGIRSKHALEQKEFLENRIQDLHHEASNTRFALKRQPK